MDLEDLRRAFDAIRAIAPRSPIADSESQNLTDAIMLICEGGREKARAIEAAMQRSPGAATAPTASPRSGLHAHRDSNGINKDFTVRGALWTIDRLLDWTHAVEQGMALLHPGASYDAWRADLADAGVGIDVADEWPRIRRRLTTHWERLESDYARRWWARHWYTRLLDPRPCGWPDYDA